jgi:hypothetical protein
MIRHWRRRGREKDTYDGAPYRKEQNNSRMDAGSRIGKPLVWGVKEKEQLSGTAT